MHLYKLNKTMASGTLPAIAPLHTNKILEGADRIKKDKHGEGGGERDKEREREKRAAEENRREGGREGDSERVA